jgi:hypothetical protein
MPNVKVTCDCGAIYEMIETEGSSRESKPLNVSCARRNYSRGRGLMLVSFASSGVPTRIEETNVLR